MSVKTNDQFANNYSRHEPEWLNNYKNVGTILVSKSLYHKYVEYLFEIDELISKNQPIPAALAKRFFALQQKDKDIIAKRNKIEIRNKVKIDSERMITYFSNYKDYIFSGKSLQTIRTYSILVALFGDKDKAADYEQKLISYSFKEMIELHLHSYFVNDILLAFNSKGAIKFFYENVNDYCNRRLNENHKKALSDYKRRAIAAYLAICVGQTAVDPSKKKTLSPEDLFRITNNALRPSKKTKA